MQTPSYEAQVTTWEEIGWPSMQTINLDTMTAEQIDAVFDRLEGVRPRGDGGEEVVQTQERAGL